MTTEPRRSHERFRSTRLSSNTATAPASRMAIASNNRITPLPPSARAVADVRKLSLICFAAARISSRLACWMMSALKSGLRKANARRDSKWRCALTVGLMSVNKRVHRLSVQRPEIHRRFQKAQRHHRLRHMQHDGIPHVRNGDAVADGGGFQGLTRQQDLQQKLAVHLVRQPQHLHHTAKNGRLVLAGQTIENSPHLQGVGQFGKRRRAVLRFLKNPWRNVDAIGCGPFQQFCPVEPVLSTQPVTGQFPLINPAINCLFRYIQ